MCKCMKGEGDGADIIRKRFENAVRSLGIGLRAGRLKGLDTSHFRPPAFSASAVADEGTTIDGWGVKPDNLIEMFKVTRK